jgi:sortase system peptidoglycan-associated protein
MIVTKLSKKVILGTAILACFSSSASFASDWDEEPADTSTVTYKEGHWGMGTGAVTGAAVGGPPGLVLGAIVGKLYGRHQGMQNAIDERDVKLKNLHVQISERNKTITSLQHQEEKKQLMVASLNDVPMQGRPDFGQLLQQGFTYSIYFKTGSDRIEDHLIDHCQALARMLKSFPDLEVNLDGYADLRGEESFNRTLSEKRLQAVKALLIQEGIEENAIHVSAKGEQEILNLGTDQDSFSFDRRVVITFSQQDGQS